MKTTYAFAFVIFIVVVITFSSGDCCTGVNSDPALHRPYQPRVVAAVVEDYRGILRAQRVPLSARQWPQRRLRE